MAIVKGVWLFNETITKIPVSENVNFSVTFSDGSIGNYDRMFISGKDLEYKQAGQSGVACAYFYSISPNRFANEVLRTVDFGTTEQTVTDEFYTWLTANAVQQSSGPSEPETDILYTVNGSSLTAVANAIRGKTGTTGALAFPSGYVSAVNDISVGGGEIVLPDGAKLYYSGKANSSTDFYEFRFDSESSAVGTLS